MSSKKEPCYLRRLWDVVTVERRRRRRWKQKDPLRSLWFVGSCALLPNRMVETTYRATKGSAACEIQSLALPRVKKGRLSLSLRAYVPHHRFQGQATTSLYREQNHCSEVTLSIDGMMPSDGLWRVERGPRMHKAGECEHTNFVQWPQ